MIKIVCHEFAAIRTTHVGTSWNRRTPDAKFQCVSNSLSGRDWEPDQVVAMGDPVVCENPADRLSVSNSWSGGDGELDEVSTVGDPAHMIQVGACCGV